LANIYLGSGKYWGLTNSSAYNIHTTQNEHGVL